MRFAAFAFVGACGLVVQMAALEVLLTATAAGPVVATAIAVELAVIHNFAWHERWTWRDRRAATTGQRLVRFHVANGVMSVGVALACVALLTRTLGWSPVLANTVAVALTGIVNFLALDRWVFAMPRRAL